ncbi:MAG: bifunctional (p)ppGpp synthetase/guanosine-3',5'-bis(diphosphate) 3'-pyrophosphohydrolase [Acidobacteria bacterium]|nr:MAG: bifunctional (p)ppGpp synthetase/guanosine-3',5'-bis(diphosphate) 3'-pyrophosphohydrolase [Acidobacteriota bacterium]
MARTAKKPRAPISLRPGITFDDVLERLTERGRPCDRAFLQRVYDFARSRHGDQKRRSGEPYFTHPTYVAYILADLGFDQTCVAVGLLHDVLEDTDADRRALAEAFGDDVAELVDGVTKIGQQAYVRRDDAQAETFRKMILASAKDIRVIMVKLADRLHNMLTLEHMSPEHQRRVSQETLEIYAPIAHRLGMAKVKGDLEDLAFYHLYPRQYAELEAKIREKMRGGEELVRRVEQTLREKLVAAGIEAEISSRVKRYYSIFTKLRRQGIDISQLYDYLAFRIITEEIKDCYAALGVVHQSWCPVPGRFKDYIAMPKPNLYQSLHTTVVGERGQPFEVQIRTREMDLVAEEGIAAHWHYKEHAGDSRQAAAGDPNILWLRQLLEWQKDTEDSRTFLTQLKIDLYPEEVYVFTPKGDVFSFPRGATPLDFAYRIHTDVGHHCSGARVNGKLVPLRTPLKNGDMVEIMTSSSRQPSRDWLSIVATSRAKAKIRHWLNTQQKREAEAIGRRLLERELKRLRVSAKKVLDGEAMAAYVREEGLQRVEDLYRRIAYGKTPVRQVLLRLIDDERLTSSREQQPGALRRAVDRYLPFGTGPVQVHGEGDLVTTLAKCCGPVPGEPLVGYVTRGRGISVHAEDCPNVRNLLYDPERLIEVEWARQGERSFPVALSIETEDHQGMLAKLTEVIAKESSNIRNFEATTVEPGFGIVDLVVEVKNRRHLERLRRAIRGVPGVRAVARPRAGARRARAAG